jgi:hypothetical protein
MNEKQKAQNQEQQTAWTPPLMSLSRFRKQVGVSHVTAWRWRRAGWLKAVNISGRQYVTAEAMEDFTRRSASGEFATNYVRGGVRKIATNAPVASKQNAT